MKNTENFLEQLGLTNMEAKAYDLSLELGAFAASILASRLGIPRTTARYICESLVQKKLMTETKKANTKIFVAENPTKLYSILYAEQENLDRKKNQLAITIKELQEKYNPKAKLPKITFYEGIDGIERLANEMISRQSDLFSFSAGDYFLLKQPELIEKFRSKSIKKYKNVYVFRAPKYKQLHKDNTQSIHRYFRFIEELKIDIQITEDRLSIISLENSSPMGILITHQDIVNGFKQIFSELWRRENG